MGDQVFCRCRLMVRTLIKVTLLEYVQQLFFPFPGRDLGSNPSSDTSFRMRSANFKISKPFIFEKKKHPVKFPLVVKWYNNRLITGHYKFDSCREDQAYVGESPSPV